MTTAELALLTPEQKRERIAVLAGFTNVRSLPRELLSADNPDAHSDRKRIFLPHYLRDRNAVAAVLAGLSDDDHEAFRHKLHGCVKPAYVPMKGYELALLQERAYVMPDPALACDAILLALC